MSTMPAKLLKFHLSLLILLIFIVCQAVKMPCINENPKTTEYT